MEFGKLYDEGRTAHYASGVMDASPEELDRFYGRVNDWARSSGVVLGEGRVEIHENGSESPYPKDFVLRAPVIEGDTDCAFFVAVGPLA